MYMAGKLAGPGPGFLSQIPGVGPEWVIRGREGTVIRDPTWQEPAGSGSSTVPSPG